MLIMEKSTSLVLQIKWKLANVKGTDAFFYNKVKYKKNDFCRVGYKNSSPSPVSSAMSSPTLIFVTTNLNKIGLKAVVVNFSSGNDSVIKEMELLKGEENGVTQLFTAPILEASHRWIEWPLNFNLNFTVYMNGIVENYKVFQMDRLISKELCSSVSNKIATDFNLIAKDGKTFKVHKWMLAARSNVFEVLLRNDVLKAAESNLSMNCTSNELGRFIKFMYTGEFEGEATSGLMQLAVNYEVKNLENLLRAALQDISLDQMAAVAMHLKPGTLSRQSQPEIATPDSNRCSIRRDEENLLVLNVSWKLNPWTLASPTSSSELFEFHGIKLFRAELEFFNSPAFTNPEELFKVKFLSYGHQLMSCITEQVIFSIGKQQIEMIENNTHDRKLLQVFSIDETKLSKQFNRFGSAITLNIHLRCTVPNYINKPIDSTLSEQLLSAAVNRKMTDVEFLVGEEIFGAHRSLLSVRSPVFAAMFASGMKEAETGQVRIEDIDPGTFQYFLKFLYTGMLEPSYMNEELFIVADKYRVETLMELCRPAVVAKSVEMDHILDTFLSS